MSFLGQLKSKVAPAEIISAIISQHGGVQGVVQILQQGGLSNVVQSWIGTGKNLPVSGAMLGTLLGEDRIAALASRFGMSPQALQDDVSAMLPLIIDKLSPQGQLNSEPSALSRFLAMGEAALKSH